MYTFAENNEAKIMNVFLATLIMMTTGSVAFFIIVRNLKKHYQADDRTRIVLSCLILTTVMVFCNLMCGGRSMILRLPFEMLIAIFPLMVVTSSLWEMDTAVRLGRYLLIPISLMPLFYILHGLGFIPMFPAIYYVSLSGGVAILICLFYMLALSLRMREIRLVMRNGNVWSSVCMTMDVIYLLFLIVYVMLFLITSGLSMSHTYVISIVVSLLLAFEIAAIGLRVSLDSIFVLWRRHERRIVESMKISQTDVSQESTKINELYKEVYSRVVYLFETDKPYLNSELTINDIVKVTFTNKLYISRAISQFTGRNFCQFVNYYRVSYSIQLFRSNPELKVIELATQSGFNSSVSYSMAFRLYMGESPSDWCRKEKVKLVRKKK